MSHPVILDEVDFFRVRSTMWGVSQEILRLRQRGATRTMQEMERYLERLRHACEEYDSRVHADRRGGWIILSPGKRFWPLDPRPGDFDIDTIAHGLARINRFNGRTMGTYSVAQHSVHVHDIVAGGRSRRLFALLHDASEAYIQDIITPIKHFIGQPYADLENRVMLAIAERFGFDLMNPEDCQAVKEADEILLVTEVRDLIPGGYLGFDPPRLPLTRILSCWTVEEAEQEFRDRYFSMAS